MRGVQRIQVIKCGGSVLDTEEAIADTCRYIASLATPNEPLVVVVSAPAGVTDALYQSVPLEASTSGDEIAEHVSSGERKMAARLTEHLQSLGVQAATLSVHDIGLRASGPPLDADPVSLDVKAILTAFNADPVLVIPGFAGVGSSGARRLLGRGGSDLSAVFIACELGASCRLLQQATGVFEQDPEGRADTPPRFASLHWDDLLDLDTEVVQGKAVRLAKQRRLEFVVSAITPDFDTVVGDVLPVMTTERSRHASS